MKVAYFTKPRTIEVVEEPQPKVEQSTDVLVRIDRFGICGSDVHYFVDGGIGRQRLTYPASLGHECSGTIVEIGSGVANLRPGDRVAIDPALSCHQCDQCRVGRVNTCRHIQFMGSPGQAPGAAAEYRVLPAANCLPVPASMSLDVAALIEPLSIGLYAVRMAEVYPAARIAIFGAGPIGLSVLLCAKAAAPCTVYVTDLLDERLTLARKCGADWTGNAEDSSAIHGIAENEPWGLDFVFECSGDPATINHAQQLLTPGGVLLLIGIPPQVEVPFDIHLMRTNELVFRSVRRQKGCVAPAIRLVAEGHIRPEGLITHRFGWSNLQQAFEMAAAYRDGLVKGIIRLSDAD